MDEQRQGVKEEIDAAGPIGKRDGIKDDSRSFSKTEMNSIYILTLAIGADYKRALAKCLQSKRDYAEKQGYIYIEGDEQFWNRERPIAWSKVPFLLHWMNKLPENSILWLSDADVFITNPNLRIEEHVLPLLNPEKDFLMSIDACGHINSGNVFFRNTAWARDYWKRVWEQEDCIYHIWWENAAMIKLLETNPIDQAHIQLSTEHIRFNAFLRGIPGQPLWKPNDFLVHFAGVYDAKQMENLVEEILKGKIPRLSMG